MASAMATCHPLPIASARHVRYEGSDEWRARRCCGRSKTSRSDMSEETQARSGSCGGRFDTIESRINSRLSHRLRAPAGVSDPGAEFVLEHRRGEDIALHRVAA